MVKYNYFYLIFICLFGLTTHAQKVSNITFKQEQSNIVVSYDLETKTPCKVSLYVSTNNGASWQGPLKKVTGNIGDKVVSGKKNIVWNVLEEFQELTGTNIKFQVRANEEKPQSISSINKQIIKNPKDAKLFKLRGDLKHELKDTDGAIADYTKAISLNPKYADAYKERGKLMFGNCNYEAAISDFNKAIGLNPKDASTFYERANSKFGLEDFEAAKFDYSKAIELEPNNTKFIFARARAKRELKENFSAIEDINKVIELDSTYDYGRGTKHIYFIRGFYKYSNKDFEGFDKDINYYVKYSTNPSEALSEIAGRFIFEKEYITAIDYYTKSINLLPETLVDSLEQRQAYYGRAFLLYLQKNESGASDDFNRYIEKSQNKAKANLNIACGFLNNGFVLFYSFMDNLDIKNLNKAIYYFTKAIELDPNNSYYYETRALAKEELKDYSGAIADYSKAIELKPDAYLYAQRATPKFDLNDFRGAIEDYSKAIELEPNEAYYYSNRGNAKFIIRDYKGAIADYTKEILLDPKNGIGYLKRGNAKKMIKDKKGACEDFSKAGELGEDKAYKSINENCNK